MSVCIPRLPRPAIALATLLFCLTGAKAEPHGQPVSITSPPDDLAQVVRQEAEKRGVPLALADALLSALRGSKADAAGSLGQVGLMQIHPAMAKMHGYKGDAAGLLYPEINIRFGMLHLAGAWALAKGDVCLALVKYRTGYAEEEITPADARDCAAVRARLAELGSSLATDRSKTAAKVAPARPSVSEPERRRENARLAPAQPSQPGTRSAIVSPRKRIPAGGIQAPAPKEADASVAVTPRASAHLAVQQTSNGKAGSGKRNPPDLAVARIIAGGRTTWQPIPQAGLNRANARRWAEHEERLRQIESRVSPNIIQIMRP